MNQSKHQSKQLLLLSISVLISLAILLTLGWLFWKFYNGNDNDFSVTRVNGSENPELSNTNSDDKLSSEEPNSILLPLEKRITGHSGQVYAVVTSPDMRTVVSGGNDKTIKFWSLAGVEKKSEEPLQTLGSQGIELNNIDVLTISPNGKVLASGGWGGNGNIDVWEFPSGGLLNRLPGQEYNVKSLVLSSQGKTLISGSGDGIIKIWDTETGELIATLTGHSRGVTALALNEQKNILASGDDDGNIKIWDIETSSLRREWDGHAKSTTIMALAFGKKENILVSSNNKGNIKIWDAESNSLKIALTGHSGSVTSLVLDDQENLLVSGGRDGLIKIWEVSTGGNPQLIYRLSEYTDESINLNMIQDGQILSVGYAFSTIKIWQLAQNQ